jgi:hypothetical protein
VRAPVRVLGEQVAAGGGAVHSLRDMATLEGRWKVRRESGLLPPLGVSKRIGVGSGWTLLAGLPVASFRVEDAGGEARRLRYRLLPIRDELSPRADGSWVGRGLLLGREFCRFRLEPSGSARG